MSIVTFVLAAVIAAALVTATVRPGWSVTRHQPLSSIVIRASLGVMTGSALLVMAAAAFMSVDSELASTVATAAALTFVAGGGSYALTVAIRKHSEGYQVHPLPIALGTIVVALFGALAVAYALGSIGRNSVAGGTIDRAVSSSYWFGVSMGAGGTFMFMILGVGTFLVVRSLRRGRFSYPVLETLAQERAEIRDHLTRL